jgi:hypothetical protein
MLENPFLQSPQVQSALSDAWAKGFAFGFQGPPASLPPPDFDDPAVSEAFNQGLLAGQQTAIDGFALLAECVDLREEPPTPSDLIPSGFEVALTIREVVKHGIISGVGSAILAIVDLCVGATTHFHDPSEAVAAKASQLEDVLTGIGITDSMKLFLGGGVDFSIAGCELKLTPIFRSHDSVLGAARALGRPQFVVVSWRTDASGSAQLTDEFGF